MQAYTHQEQKKQQRNLLNDAIGNCDRVRLREPRILRAVIRRGSMAKAAHALAMTQPAMWQAIALLAAQQRHLPESHFMPQCQLPANSVSTKAGVEERLSVVLSTRTMISSWSTGRMKRHLSETCR